VRWGESGQIQSVHMERTRARAHTYHGREQTPQSKRDDPTWERPKPSPTHSATLARELLTKPQFPQLHNGVTPVHLTGLVWNRMTP
jgi:hypothetical protein